MSIPAPFAVLHSASRAGGFDDDGYPVPAESKPPVQRAVYGWWQESSAERASEDAPGRRVSVLSLLVPDPAVYRPGDLVEVCGRGYEVTGDPADHGAGPFGYNPGGVVRAVLVEG